MLMMVVVNVELSNIENKFVIIIDNVSINHPKLRNHLNKLRTDNTHMASISYHECRVCRLDLVFPKHQGNRLRILHQMR